MEEEEEEGHQSKSNGEQTKKGRGEGWYKVRKGRFENREGGEVSELVKGGEVTTGWASREVTKGRGRDKVTGQRKWGRKGQVGR